MPLWTTAPWKTGENTVPRELRLVVTHIGAGAGLIKGPRWPFQSWPTAAQAYSELQHPLGTRFEDLNKRRILLCFILIVGDSDEQRNQHTDVERSLAEKVVKNICVRPGRQFSAKRQAKRVNSAIEPFSLPPRGLSQLNGNYASEQRTGKGKGPARADIPPSVSKILRPVPTAAFGS